MSIDLPQTNQIVKDQISKINLLRNPFEDTAIHNKQPKVDQDQVISVISTIDMENDIQNCLCDCIDIAFNKYSKQIQDKLLIFQTIADLENKLYGTQIENNPQISNITHTEPSEVLVPELSQQFSFQDTIQKKKFKNLLEVNDSFQKDIENKSQNTSNHFLSSSTMPETKNSKDIDSNKLALTSINFGIDEGKSDLNDFRVQINEVEKEITTEIEGQQELDHSFNESNQTDLDKFDQENENVFTGSLKRTSSVNFAEIETAEISDQVQKLEKIESANEENDGGINNKHLDKNCNLKNIRRITNTRKDIDIRMSVQLDSQNIQSNNLIAKKNVTKSLDFSKNNTLKFNAKSLNELMDTQDNKLTSKTTQNQKIIRNNSNPKSPDQIERNFNIKKEDNSVKVSNVSFPESPTNNKLKGINTKSFLELSNVNSLKRIPAKVIKNNKNELEIQNTKNISLSDSKYLPSTPRITNTKNMGKINQSSSKVKNAIDSKQESNTSRDYKTISKNNLIDCKTVSSNKQQVSKVNDKILRSSDKSPSKTKLQKSTNYVDKEQIKIEDRQKSTSDTFNTLLMKKLTEKLKK